MASLTRTRWDLIPRVISALGTSGRTRTALLWGPPGTGKTYTAAHAPDPNTGGPMDPSKVFFLGLNYESSVTDLYGHFIPVGDRFVWLNMAALAAWRTPGARLIVDEVEKAPQAVHAALLQILNDRESAMLTVPNQEMAGMTDAELAHALENGEGTENVRPSEGVHVICTSNAEPRDLPEALQDRLVNAHFIGEPHPDAVKRVLESIDSLGGPYRANDAVGSMIVDACLKADETERIGLRSWLTFADLAHALGSPEDAAYSVWAERSGDVLDALKIAARPSGSTSESEDEPEDESESESESAAPATRARPTGGPVKAGEWPNLPALPPGTPVFYGRNTGRRGNKPRLKCGTCGAPSGTRTILDSTTGDLTCGARGCGSHLAAAGEWVRLVANPATGRWPQG